MSRPRKRATSSELELYPIVKEIYEGARTRTTPIRLLGIALSNLGFYDEQLTLFDDDHERLHDAVDEIRGRWGFDAVRLATAVPAPRE